MKGAEMPEKLDLYRLFPQSMADVLMSMVDIVHKLEYRDFDFFYRDLVKLGEEKIFQWTNIFASVPRIRSKLCMLGLADAEIRFFRGDHDGFMTVDLPPKDDYSDYGTAVVDGYETRFVSRMQFMVDMFLMTVHMAFEKVFDPRTDNTYRYVLLMSMWANYPNLPIRYERYHFVYSAIYTLEREIYGESCNPFSNFHPLYEETLARLFKRVLSDKKMRTWELSDVSYSLTKIEKAGKLLLPEKTESLVICDSLPDDLYGDYNIPFRRIRVVCWSMGSLIHEIGHAADYQWNLSGRDDFRPVYEAYVSLLEKDDGFQPMDRYGYYVRETECFARCYEMYIADSGFGILDEKVCGKQYPKNKAFKTMVKDYFDRLTESMSKNEIGSGTAKEVCEA